MRHIPGFTSTSSLLISHRDITAGHVDKYAFSVYRSRSFFYYGQWIDLEELWRGYGNTYVHVSMASTLAIL